MKLTTLGAADALGTPIPVFIPDTYRTRLVTTTTGVVTTPSFDSSEEARPHVKITATQDAAETDLYLYALGNVYEANHIQLHITVGNASESYSIERKEVDLILTINLKTGFQTIAKIVEFIGSINNALGKTIISCSYDANKSSYSISSAVRTYFKSYSPGRCANLVRILTFDDGVFIGNFPESGDPWKDSNTIVPLASMPLVAGVETYIMLSPNEMLSVSGGGTAGKKVYITPQRNY